MRKVSDTFLFVATILSYISAGIYLSCSLIFFIIFGVYREDIALNIVMITLGSVFIVLGSLCIFYGMFLKVVRENKTKNLFIAAIVLGAIMSEIGLVGAILGLIANSRNIE